MKWGIIVGIALLIICFWVTPSWAWVTIGDVYGCSDTFHPEDIDAPTHSFTSISATGTSIALGDNEVSGALPLGFDFIFFGTTYTEVSLSSNGLIFFDSPVDSGCCTGASIPSDDSYNNIIAFLWEDLDPSMGGGVYYETIGAPGTRSFIIEFNDVPHSDSSSDNVTLQLELREDGSEILIHYVAEGNESGTHTIGLEDSGGTSGVEWYRGSLADIDLAGHSIRCIDLTTYDGDGDGFHYLEDCEDGDAAIHPDAEDVCDFVDNDCDGDTDEIEAVVTDDTYACFDSFHPEHAEAPVHVWASIAATGTSLSFGDDEMSAAIPLGFEFEYYGETHTEVSISSNGFVRFSGSREIYFLNEDLDPPEGGAVYYETAGAAGSRTFTVEYFEIQHFPSGTPVTVQMVLHEGTNEIFFHYLVDSDDTDIHWIALDELLYYSGSMADIALDGQSVRCIPYWLMMYPDDDGDGYGVTELGVHGCGTLAGHVEVGGDCNDIDDAIHPDVEDVCDGIDNDCNGLYDDRPVVLRDLTYECFDSLHPEHTDAPVHTWDSIAATGATLPTGDDVVSDAIPIGFVFDFYGTPYSEVYISSNGWVSFLPTTDADYAEDPIPTPGGTDGFIALFWDDMDSSRGSGAIYYETIGIAGSRSFVVEFSAIEHIGGGSPVTAQLELLEDGNEILLHYLTDSDESSGHSIGIEDADGIDGIQYHFGGLDEVDLDGQSIRCIVDSRGTFYRDSDEDMVGDESDWVRACVAPEGYVDNSADCDDSDPALPVVFFADYDLDGYGDWERWVAYCDGSEPPSLYIPTGGDCDDTNDEINPAATEVCDEVDNDCDGLIDVGAPLETFYADTDADGYGDDEVTIAACFAPDGYVEEDGDCDDTLDTVHPLASEMCDGLDNNCNDVIDEGLTTTYYVDADGDGHGDILASIEACELPEGYVVESSADDCDDSNDAVYPDADELCDGVDNDCDDEIDEGDDHPTFYLDSDEDGYGDADFTTQACEAPDGYVDNDQDCDDLDATVNPSRSEVCDEVDNDCDGEIDEEGGSTFYEDADGDGFGDELSAIEACTLPDGYATNGDDCDDALATVNPNAVELADEIDNDCDGEIDEEMDSTDDEDGCGCRASGASPSGWASGALFLILSLFG